jgi:hypothetical protein
MDVVLRVLQKLTPTLEGASYFTYPTLKNAQTVNINFQVDSETWWTIKTLEDLAREMREIGCVQRKALCKCHEC